MARRGTLLAYVRRDDSDPVNPTLLVPVSWTLIREAEGWCTVYPFGRTGSSVIAGTLREHSDVFFHAWIAMTHATLARACFVVVGHPYVLQALSDRIAADGLVWTQTWSSLVDLRNDTGTVAQAIKAAWRAGSVALPGRISGYEDDDAESA